VFGSTLLRREFPIFNYNPQLIYLDSAATSHKPSRVIDGITDFYKKENSSIHRGVYELAARATQKYESVRQKVSNFIGAQKTSEIIYTSGTTSAINLVAQSFLAPRLKGGDRVIVSALEHHANLIPWQMACKKAGAQLKIIPIDDFGNIDLNAFKQLLTSRTKLVAVTHVSNVLGTMIPISEMIEMAHQQGVPVLVDGAQSAAHYPIDVKMLDCDFFTFSGHKIFGPTGIGILYGKADLLAEMEPCKYGGDMIRRVTYQETTFADAPQKFEAGTTNIAGVIGLGYAIDFINRFDKKEMSDFIADLGAYTRSALLGIEGLSILGDTQKKSGIVSFTLDGIHPHDIATFLGEYNIAIRAGHHCAQPLMALFGVPATSRISFSIYNNRKEVDFLVEKLKAIQQFLA